MPEMLFEETVKEAAGWMSVKESRIEFPTTRITEVTDLLYNHTYNGRRLQSHEREYLIREALTTEDFPLLFADVLDRQLLAAYKDIEPVWKNFVKISTVRDFKTAKRFATWGGDQLLAEVTEKGEYLASPRNEIEYQIAVLKRGRQFDISWETLINDDLGALRDTPERFARAVRRTEHRLVSAIYASDWGAAGTHVEGTGGVLYETGVNATASAASPLTIANLEAGVQTMNSFVDLVGEPIMATPKFLVVCPALEMTARAILTSAVYQMTTAAAIPMPTANVIATMGLQLLVDKYLPIVNAGANDQDTQWYLFADPADLAAIEVAYLSGHENPELAMKNSDKVSVGGGPISPFDGDFATDNVFYRVRSIFGVAKLDWRGTYMGGYVV